MPAIFQALLTSLLLFYQLILFNPLSYSGQLVLGFVLEFCGLEIEIEKLNYLSKSLSL